MIVSCGQNSHSIKNYRYTLRAYFTALTINMAQPAAERELRILIKFQQVTGDFFQHYYRNDPVGLIRWDEMDLATQMRMNNRPIPQQPGATNPSAYNVPNNTQLKSRRDEWIRRRLFIIVDAPDNVGRRALRVMPQDKRNEAIANFQQLKRRWGNQIECQ
jgi:hypothetical protein